MIPPLLGRPVFQLLRLPLLFQGFEDDIRKTQLDRRRLKKQHTLAAQTL
jgi:hypothetical protein